MGNPIMTPGQGFFTQGLDRTAPVYQDSTKEAGQTADILAGAPLALLGTDIGTGDEAGKLHTAPVAANDGFYGVSSSNINILLGRTSLGEFEAKRANAEIQGRFIVRKSVFLNSAFAQVEINPFVMFPATTDRGKLLHAVTIRSSGNDVVDQPLTNSAVKQVMKWLIAGGGQAGAQGFESVARIVSVSDDATEAELELLGSQKTFATFADGT